MNELQEQYRLLDVPADVSLSSLKQAYKDLVLVWHPDRFSDHPRLQKKAEEKLKCINLAYKELSAVHRRAKAQQATTETHHQQSSPSPEAQGTRHTPKNHQYKQQERQHCSGHAKTYHSDISLEQARFIVSHFHFRGVKRATRNQQNFKSGPFRLELNLLEQKVFLENLCDSINGFHPILLTIPCKATGLFLGADAQQLITLFQSCQGR